MAGEIVMPRLSDTMEEGTILRWLKRDGEQIARGEELAEIETDKAAMTYESDQAGTLELLAAEGDTLAVGQPIARLRDAGAAGVGETETGTDAPGDTDADAGADAPEAVTEADASATAPGNASGGTVATAPEMSDADRATTTTAADAPAAGGQPGSENRVRASPLARRMAREGGIDLHGVTPSGPGGRIVKADVLAAAGATAPEARASGEDAAGAGAPSAVSDQVATAKGETEIVELSRSQQAVARRMAESKATIPDFAVQIEVDMEACVALRSELKSLAEQHAAAMTGGHAEAPTYNDMIVKASALALREHPKANGSYRDGQLQLHSRVNVGVAVAGEDALVVPTVFDADEKSLGEIARETHRLAARVRDATITPPELGGGTFTVSNLGMFGVSSFTAIINPPQAAILAVGALAQRPVAQDSEPAVRHTLTLTLVCDHRILFGADAARFLGRVRELLQTPAALTL